MGAASGDPRQLSALEGDVEGFGISPRGDKAWYVQRVQAAARRSSDIHTDMDKSKARIYDDLMVRHWDYWDEGEHLHIFVGDFGADGLKPGVDIIGADAAWDAPLAPYFDMAEIAWNHAGTMHGHGLRRIDRLGHLRLRRGFGTDAEHLQADELQHG